MFDLVSGNAPHIPSRPTVPILISTITQGVLAAIAIAVPLLLVSDRLPAIPTMMAFVAAPPAPPPPPPPPAPAARKPTPPEKRPVPTSGATAPIDAPTAIEPIPANEEGFFDSVPGGVEGGVPGGIIGGVVGGLPDVPPLPPPPLAPRQPVRVGGQIQAPALLHRVEPIYPALAVQAHAQGTVILEALVDEDGRVIDVTVLRSAAGVLDRAAIEAVRQWRYSPIILNGIPEEFLLTVTLSFRLAKE